MNDVCAGPALPDWMALVPEWRKPVVSGCRRRQGQRVTLAPGRPGVGGYLRQQDA